MWKVDKIKCRNVGSYKELEYDILQNKTVSIIGENRDDIGQESNGAGKSWLLEMFAIAILGHSLKKVRNVDLIRTGEKEMGVHVYMSNDHLGREMSIGRVFPIKGSSKISVLVDGQDQSDKFPGGDSESFVLGQIGISKEDLLGYYLISKTRYKSYLSSSDTVKKEVIARFSGSDVINGVETLVEGQVDGLERVKRTVEDLIVRLGAKIEVYENDLEREMDVDFEAEKSERIKAVELLIDQKEKGKEQANEKIDYFRGEIGKINGTKETFKRDLAGVGSVDDKQKLLEEIGLLITSVLDRVNENDKAKEEQTKKASELRGFKNEINTKLKGAVKCPECFHEFSVTDEKMDVEKARGMIPKINQKIDEADSEAVRLSGVRGTLVADGKKHRDRQNNVNQEINLARQKVQRFNQDIARCETNIGIKEQSIKGKEESLRLADEAIGQQRDRIEEIRKEDRKSREAEINKNIESTKLEIVNSTIQLQEKEDAIFKEKQWVFNFKRFAGYLAVKVLKVIEGRTNIVLESFGSDLRVELEGFKELASGEIREKIAAHIWRQDGERGVMDKFSNGEKARVEAASIIALQSLINQASPGGGLNLLIIDEIMDSVDPMGIELMLNNLNKTGRTIMLVSQVGVNIINYEHVLKAVKENKETKLIMQ